MNFFKGKNMILDSYGGGKSLLGAGGAKDNDQYIKTN